jgi:hypothetical protein
MFIGAPSKSIANELERGRAGIALGGGADSVGGGVGARATDDDPLADERGGGFGAPSRTFRDGCELHATIAARVEATHTTSKRFIVR